MDKLIVTRKLYKKSATDQCRTKKTDRTIRKITQITNNLPFQCGNNSSIFITQCLINNAVVLLTTQSVYLLCRQSINTK